MARDKYSLEEARRAAASRVWEQLGLSHPPSRAEEALTHPSATNELGPLKSPKRHATGPSYQRLEFLGDAVLDLCVCELLFEEFPQADEGSLSRMRSALVKTEALAEHAAKLGLGEALRVGKGAAMTGTQHGIAALADTFESVLAAIFLDHGLDTVRALVRRHVLPQLTQHPVLDRRDPKSELQERVQALRRQTPTYHVIPLERGDPPDLARIEIQVAGEVLGRGEGPSRRSAEQAAARDALSRIESSLPAG